MSTFVTRAAFVATVIEHVARHLGIAIHRMLVDRGRTADRGRMLAMYMVRELTALSLPEIGLHFNRDHSTVVAACRRIKKLLTIDQQLQGMVAELRLQLSGEVQVEADSAGATRSSSYTPPAARVA